MTEEFAKTNLTPKNCKTSVIVVHYWLDKTVDRHVAKSVAELMIFDLDLRQCLTLAHI